MPLWRVATAPDDLDAGADALDASDEKLIHLSPPKAGQSNDSSPDTTQAIRSTLSGPFLVQAELPTDMNKNTSWFSYPGVWSMYFIIVLLVWLLILATVGCSISTAWVIVNCTHFVVTFYLFHWKKGSPFPDDDQKNYDKLTWWEQMDSGRQLTRNRKFLTLVPVVLFLVASLASRHEPHASSVLFMNTFIVFTLVIAKLPMLHKIRILGINS